MNRKKIFGLLAVMAIAGASLAGCQSDPSNSLGTVSSKSQTGLNTVTLYQNGNPLETSVKDGRFGALEQSITAAFQNADHSPQWVSSVVTEDWLEPYFENGNVLEVTFQDTRSFTFDSLPRTFDKLLVIEKENWIVFSEGGQYQSGPLMISAEDTGKIFEQEKEIHK